MGPAVRRTRSQSRITAAPVQDPNCSGSKVGIAGAVRSNFALIARLPGTEFFDAETRRQKSSRKRANACRDQSLGSKWPEIPAEAPYLASTREGVVCGDWMVEMVWFELAAPHAVRSNRVSATRLDRCDLAFAPRGVRIGTSARTCTERGGMRKMRRPAGIVRLVRMNRPVDPAL